MARLTTDQRKELNATLWFTDHLNGPTYIWAGLHNDSVMRSLIRRGLITWRKADPESGWSLSFREVKLTDKGLAALEDTNAA